MGSGGGSGGVPAGCLGGGIPVGEGLGGAPAVGIHAGNPINNGLFAAEVQCQACEAACRQQEQRNNPRGHYD